MLDFLDSIPAEWRPFAVVIFVLFGGSGAVAAYVRGKKIGPESAKVHEFAMTGQLSDMGPVRELVETTGLLVQQQIRTNMALEALAAEARKATEAYAGHLREVEIEEEVQRRVKEATRG